MMIRNATRVRLADLPSDQQRLAKLESRVRYLPQAIDRAKAKVERLEDEAVSLGLMNRKKLIESDQHGDLIANEYLRRLGYFR